MYLYSRVSLRSRSSSTVSNYRALQIPLSFWLCRFVTGVRREERRARFERGMRSSKKLSKLEAGFEVRSGVRRSLRGVEKGM